jgi:hypothetical protein
MHPGVTPTSEDDDVDGAAGVQYHVIITSPYAPKMMVSRLPVCSPAPSPFP